MISFDDFLKLEIKIGEIKVAESIEGLDKILRLEVDFGEETRQILAGIAQFYEIDNLIGKKIPVIVNLEPRKIKGLESQGMIMAADVDGAAVLLHPDKDVPAGSVVR